MNSKSENFRTDIASLRALAVTLVLLSHFGIPGFTFGFIGVDIFFVISGFLITRTLYIEYLTSSPKNPMNSSISLSNFYLRRIRRLVPAALTVILIVNIISFYINNQILREKLVSDSRWALLFLANVSFLRSGSDYFQQGNEPSMLQHYWSLSVEEQFYFIWPILFLIAANLQRFKVLGKSIRFNIRILIFISLISGVSLIFMLFSFNQSAVEAYFAIFTRAWELGVGSFFGILAYHKKSRSVYSRVEQYAPLITAILLSSLLINNKNWAYMIPFPVVATGIFLYFGQNRKNNSHNSVGLKSYLNRFIIYIGTISYSLYLVHWPIWIIVNRLVLNVNLAIKIFLVPVSIIFGHLIWKYVEIPFQKIPLPKRGIWEERFFYFLKSRRFLVCSIFMITVGSLYVVTYPQVSSKVFYSTNNLSALNNDPNLRYFADYQSKILSTQTNSALQYESNAQDTTVASSGNLLTSYQKIVNSLTEGLKSSKLTVEEVSAFKKLSEDKSEFEKSTCFSTLSVIPPDCAIGGNLAGIKKVALIGDSKMGFFVKPLSDYFSKKNWRVVPLVMPGCHISDPSNDTVQNCTKRSSWILSNVESTKYDAIVTAEWPGLFNAEFQNNYYSTLKKNTEKLIILQTNRLVPSPQDCIQPDYSFTEKCTTIPTGEVSNMQREQSFLRGLASPNTYVIESQNWICVGIRCPLTANGVFVTRDGSHLTATYVKSITPLLNETLDSIFSG